ncbi:chromate transporter [Peptoniphilus sp. KCTC 25270]|uniref:chromate transporter n=1 Tax=Peptoniphilus sp. KCTC 25270 TaxID=2897414 RepID=UPI001E47832E|nr:chromate transporter [Peptoniphilus sp. KCTC 25270]MCD1147928.1 chromate transporter [Peptoniphilus sp. KCTC 25270]
MLLLLYFEFLKIGILAFGGGYAVLPLIQQFIVEERGWITMTEFTDLVSISQMTPGPIFINSATFVGSRVAGVPGSIVATIGSVTPQCILMMILGYFLFTKNKKFPLLDKILSGIRPGIVGLILIASLSMLQNSVFYGVFSLHSINPIAAICFIIGILGYGSKKINLIPLVGLGGLLGILLAVFLP